LEWAISGVRIRRFFSEIRAFLNLSPPLQVTQREKVVNMPVVNKTRHLEQDLTGGHKMPEDQMKKVSCFLYILVASNSSVSFS
jgi:hypothetical protein